METYHEEMLQALLNWCFDNTNILQAKDGKGYSLIHFASEKGFTPIVKSLLEKNVNVNLEAEDQSTLLNIPEETTKLLIEKGVNLNPQTRLKSTPLHLSAENGHTETTKLLLDKGANPNALNGFKRTPLHSATLYGLYMSALKGHTEVTKALLEKGANIDCLDKKNATPLHAAAHNGKLECVKLPIDRGAHLHLRDRDAKTAQIKRNEIKVTMIPVQEHSPPRKKKTIQSFYRIWKFKFATKKKMERLPCSLVGMRFM